MGTAGWWQPIAEAIEKHDADLGQPDVGVLTRCWNLIHVGETVVRMVGILGLADLADDLRSQEEEIDPDTLRQLGEHLAGPSDHALGLLQRARPTGASVLGGSMRAWHVLLEHVASYHVGSRDGSAERRGAFAEALGVWWQGEEAAATCTCRRLARETDLGLEDPLARRPPRPMSVYVETLRLARNCVAHTALGRAHLRRVEALLREIVAHLLSPRPPPDQRLGAVPLASMAAHAWPVLYGELLWDDAGDARLQGGAGASRSALGLLRRTEERDACWLYYEWNKSTFLRRAKIRARYHRTLPRDEVSVRRNLPPSPGFEELLDLYELCCTGGWPQRRFTKLSKGYQEQLQGIATVGAVATPPLPLSWLGGLLKRARKETPTDEETSAAWQERIDHGTKEDRVEAALGLLHREAADLDLDPEIYERLAERAREIVRDLAPEEAELGDEARPHSEREDRGAHEDEGPSRAQEDALLEERFDALESDLRHLVWKTLELEPGASPKTALDAYRQAGGNVLGNLGPGGPPSYTQILETVGTHLSRALDGGERLPKTRNPHTLEDALTRLARGLVARARAETRKHPGGEEREITKAIERTLFERGFDARAASTLARALRSPPGEASPGADLALLAGAHDRLLGGAPGSVTQAWSHLRAALGQGLGSAFTGPLHQRTLTVTLALLSARAGGLRRSATRKK